jgi:protein SCO1
MKFGLISLKISNFMRFFLFFLLVIITFGTACQSNQPTTTNNQKRFPITGKVVSVDLEGKKIELAHDDIPGFMDAMTMKFPIRNADWVFSELTKDADIRGELVVDNANSDYWLEKVGIVMSPNPSQPVPQANTKAFAKAGENMPDFSLTNQDGKSISLSNFKDKALAITFIYSRCPLPEYCVKMSTNFSDAAIIIKDSDTKDKIRLLSISFDPEKDTPAKLREYGIGYFGKNSKPDFAVWQLAVGKDKDVRVITDFIGLDYRVDEQDKTQFSHSLRTVIIAPDGKIVEIISGNEWTAEDLVRKLKSTIK